MKTFSSFILLLFCAIFFSGRLLAQKTEDVVYLRNGSIIHGKIVTDSLGTSVKILSHSGDTWAFRQEEIDSVSRIKPFEYKALLFNKKGFEVGTNAELMVRSGSNAIGNAIVPGLTLQMGYRFNNYLSAGALTGIEFYDFMEIPVAAELSFRASNQALSPIIFIRSGYSFPAEKRPDDYQYSYDSFGGYNFGAGLGVERIINENTSFVFTFGYHYQELNYHLTPLYQWIQERDRTEAYSRLRLTIGYVFK
jgi:hypothetical protein